MPTHYFARTPASKMLQTVTAGRLEKCSADEPSDYEVSLSAGSHFRWREPAVNQSSDALSRRKAPNSLCQQSRRRTPQDFLCCLRSSRGTTTLSRWLAPNQTHVQ